MTEWIYGINEHGPPHARMQRRQTATETAIAAL